MPAAAGAMAKSLLPLVVDRQDAMSAKVAKTTGNTDLH